MNNFVLTERLGDILCLDHAFAGGRCIARRHGDIAVGAPVLAAFIAQIEQRPQAALIALAPRSHSLAQPLRLGGYLAVQFVKLGLLSFQNLVAPFLELRKAGVEPLGMTPIEPQGDPRQVLEKPAVVADENLCGSVGGELTLQPFDGGQI